MRSSPLGEFWVTALQRNAAGIADAVLRDDEAFGLAGRTFAPWFNLWNNVDIGEATIDSKTIGNFDRFVTRLAGLHGSLEADLTTLRAHISAAEAMRVSEFLKLPIEREPSGRP